MSVQSSHLSSPAAQPNTKPIVYATKQALEESIFKRIYEMDHYIYETAAPAIPEPTRRDITKESQGTDESEDEDTPPFSQEECSVAIKDLIECVQRMPLQAGLDSDFMALSGKVCQQVVPSSLATFHKGRHLQDAC
jgi:hypothetical protein